MDILAKNFLTKFTEIWELQSQNYYAVGLLYKAQFFWQTGYKSKSESWIRI